MRAPPCAPALTRGSSRSIDGAGSAGPLGLAVRNAGLVCLVGYRTWEGRLASGSSAGFDPDETALGIQAGHLELFHVKHIEVRRQGGELVLRVLLRRSRGAMNIATGQVRSFREIAQDVVRIGASASTIQGTPRTGPMPHNGYRAFGIAACQRAFPDFIYTSIEDGLSRSRIS